jgi:hypothetical protein
VKVPALEHTGTSTATTYHLWPVAGDRAHAGFGWALATINDATGELQIMSDWGEWSYRWHADPRSLGAPTLSHFIAGRERGVTHNGKFYPDTYIADKLTSSDDGKRKRQRFSGEKTVARLRERIIEARRESANSARDRFPASEARDLWDALGSLEHEENEQEFHRCVCDIRDARSIVIDSEVYESFVYEPTTGYLILRDAIVPALARACTEAIAARDGRVGATRALLARNRARREART